MLNSWQGQSTRRGTTLLTNTVEAGTCKLGLGEAIVTQGRGESRV